MNLQTKWLVAHKKDFPWQALLDGILVSNDGSLALVSEVLVRPWPLGPLFTINSLGELKSEKSLINILPFESGHFIEVKPAPSQLLIISEFQQLVEVSVVKEDPNKIIGKFAEYGISRLWHITHKNNIASILEHGILNHYDARRANLNLVDISAPEVQRHRENTDSVYHRKIHEYVPLFINYRNPFLYVHKELQEHLCLLEVSLAVLSEVQYVLTDGNAAARATKYYHSLDELKHLPWDVLNAAYWTDFPDGKRKIGAEVLVYPNVLSKFIMNIHCYSKNTFDFLSAPGRNILLTRQLFF